METRKYLDVKELEVYQLSRVLSKKAWEVYGSLNYEIKKVMGDQFIRSVDSVGANIVEGYGRYHYMDRVRFYYYSRASLTEAMDHWLELLSERGFISDEGEKEFTEVHKTLEIKLNNFIASTIKNAKK